MRGNVMAAKEKTKLVAEEKARLDPALGKYRDHDSMAMMRVWTDNIPTGSVEEKTATSSVVDTGPVIETSLLVSSNSKVTSGRL